MMYNILTHLMSRFADLAVSVLNATIIARMVIGQILHIITIILIPTVLWISCGRKRSAEAIKPVESSLPGAKQKTSADQEVPRCGLLRRHASE
ncbi:hypothetical protein Y032_0015g2646 [Ancylostoma ceylanicum]|uniref:Uncharacterized protein n=2 Tax=Ancylostoma ceylanicum TaxID=53326 RepID=A0A016V8U0_9BILA|nr:hypothetical protein Y032_0015g2646 [Ancylostoma ceylanicum]